MSMAGCHPARESAVDGIAAPGGLAKLLDAYRGKRSWGQLQSHHGDSSGLSQPKEAVMTFRFRPMSQADAEAIAGWHYPEPFSFYDWAADPNDLAELLNPTARGDD